MWAPPPNSPQHRAPPRPAVLPWLPGTLGDRALPLWLGPGLMSLSTSRRVTFDAARQRLCYNVRVFIRRSCRHVFHPSPLRHPQLCPCTLHTAGVNLGMGRDGTWRIGHTRPHDTKRNTASCQRRWGAPDALGTIGTERFCGVWGAPSHSRGLGCSEPLAVCFSPTLVFSLHSWSFKDRLRLRDFLEVCYRWGSS